jgi:hypothetical protein
MVAPHTTAYLKVIFTGLSGGCEIGYGCYCYMWQSPLKLVRFPGIAAGTTACYNVSVGLERHTNLVSAAALLPKSEAPVQWFILKKHVCTRFHANPSVDDAIIESVAAAATIKSAVCVRAGVDDVSVASVRRRSSPVSTEMMFGIMVVFVAVISFGVVMVMFIE